MALITTAGRGGGPIAPLTLTPITSVPKSKGGAATDNGTFFQRYKKPLLISAAVLVVAGGIYVATRPKRKRGHRAPAL